MNWESAKKATLDRDNGNCRRCPRRATDVHHRRLRQMGSTKNEEILYGLDNLVSLCRKCHDHIHRNPRESYEQGWMVHSWADPKDVPVGESQGLSIGGLTGNPGACAIF